MHKNVYGNVGVGVVGQGAEWPPVCVQSVWYGFSGMLFCPEWQSL